MRSERRGASIWIDVYAAVPPDNPYFEHGPSPLRAHFKSTQAGPWVKCKLAFM